jgi:hypothetical protein
MRAQLVVEAASWFRARAGELAIALGQEPGRWPSFLTGWPVSFSTLAAQVLERRQPW